MMPAPLVLAALLLSNCMGTCAGTLLSWESLQPRQVSDSFRMPMVEYYIFHACMEVIAVWSFFGTSCRRQWLLTARS